MVWKSHFHKSIVVYTAEQYNTLHQLTPLRGYQKQMRRCVSCISTHCNHLAIFNATVEHAHTCTSKSARETNLRAFNRAHTRVNVRARECTRTRIHIKCGHARTSERAHTHTHAQEARANSSADTHAHTHTHTHPLARAHAHIHTRGNTLDHTQLWNCLPSYACASKWTQTHTHTHTHAQTQETHIFVCTHKWTCARACAHADSPAHRQHVHAPSWRRVREPTRNRIHAQMRPPQARRCAHATAITHTYAPTHTHTRTHAHTHTSPHTHTRSHSQTSWTHLQALFRCQTPPRRPLRNPRAHFSQNLRTKHCKRTHIAESFATQPRKHQPGNNFNERAPRENCRSTTNIGRGTHFRRPPVCNNPTGCNIQLTRNECQTTATSATDPTPRAPNARATAPPAQHRRQPRHTCHKTHPANPGCKGNGPPAKPTTTPPRWPQSPPGTQQMERQRPGGPAHDHPTTPDIEPTRHTPDSRATPRRPTPRPLHHTGHKAHPAHPGCKGNVPAAQATATGPADTNATTQHDPIILNGFT